MSVIRSILDNDLYKLTQQRAVLVHYPEVPVEYVFTDRAPTGKMTDAFHGELRSEIRAMAELRLTDDEADFLGTMPFLSPQYVEWLRNYRYDPSKIETHLENGRLSMKFKGTWSEMILWEVPLLAIVSEVYFRHNTDGWRTEDLVVEAEMRTDVKGDRLQGLRFTDFGTRRRRSYDVQDTVVRTLKKYKGFQGTSNVHLAHKHGVKAIGTMAHEWIMGVSALEGLNRANWHALTKWNEVYKGRLGIALTDTFGTKAFWKDFDPQLGRLYDGVRHDSGDPYKFTEDAIAHYESLGIWAPSKTVVYSDGLTVDKCLHLHKAFEGRIGVAFGIGTSFSNDIPESPALKIVIKLRSCDGFNVVKFSDDFGKITGDKDAQRVARYIVFGTPLDAEF